MDVPRKSETGQAFDRGAVDTRIPLYLVTGPASRAKAALFQRFTQRPKGGTVFALALMDQRSWNVASAHAAAISNTPNIVRTPLGDTCIDAGADPVDAINQIHLRRLGLLSPSLAYDAVLFEVGQRIDTGAFAAVVQNDTRIDVTYRIAGIIHPVEIDDFPFRNNPGEMQRIGEADTIILTGVPDNDDGSTTRAAAAISSLNPFASILTIEDFTHVRPWRLAPGEFSAAAAERLCHDQGMVTLPDIDDCITAVANNFYNDPRSNETPDAPLRALRIHMRGEADLMAFMQAVSELCAVHGADTLRLSAVLNVRHAEHSVVVDVIGGTLLHPAYHSNTRRSDCDICILGRGLDVAQILEAFSWCRRERLVACKELCAVM